MGTHPCHSQQEPPTSHCCVLIRNVRQQFLLQQNQAASWSWWGTFFCLVLETSLILIPVQVAAALLSPPYRYHFHHPKWSAVVTPKSAFENQREKKECPYGGLRRTWYPYTIFVQHLLGPERTQPLVSRGVKPHEEVTPKMRIRAGRGEVYLGELPYANSDCAVGGLVRATSRWHISEEFIHTCRYDAREPWNWKDLYFSEISVTYYSLMYCDPQVLYASPVQKGEQSSWGWKICIQPPSVLSVNFEASLQPSERHLLQ